jgi:diguanylate cyclase (GGDEF)-like protein
MFATAISPWLGTVFNIDANNHYTRGNYYFIFAATYMINLIILIISTIRSGERHHYQIKAKIIALSIFAVAGTSIQIIMPSVYSSWHSVTLSLILYYLMLSDYDGSFDALTRFYNRVAYENKVNKLNCRKPYSVIVMDINNFKEINDAYGHNFGDTVLIKVASVIRESFDTHSTCYRVGGDEFYIISCETDQGKLDQHLKNMTNSLEKMRKNDGRLPTIAYGYSIFKGGKAIEFQEVIKEADHQMYSSKKICKGIQSEPSMK